MKALCVVAHPDDCIIFAWPFIEAHKNFNWHILYLTYSVGDDRAEEVTKFWNKRGITVEFLGHLDDYRDMESGILSFDEGTALLSIMKCSSAYDLVLTHAQDGDYGHIHHKFVHNCVIASGRPTVFFASRQSANLTYIRSEFLDLSEIPLHADVVKDFQNLEIGNYNISEQLRKFISEE
jgi:hypothetical protein